MKDFTLIEFTCTSTTPSSACAARAATAGTRRHPNRPAPASAGCDGRQTTPDLDVETDAPASGQ